MSRGSRSRGSHERANPRTRTAAGQLCIVESLLFVLLSDSPSVLRGPSGSSGNYYSYEIVDAMPKSAACDLIAKERARWLRARLSISGSPLVLGIFYDPGARFDPSCTGVEPLPKGTLPVVDPKSEQRELSCSRSSQVLLKLQARDFITWLRKLRGVPKRSSR